MAWLYFVGWCESEQVQVNFLRVIIAIATVQRVTTATTTANKISAAMLNSGTVGLGAGAAVVVRL